MDIHLLPNARTNIAPKQTSAKALKYLWHSQTLTSGFTCIAGIFYNIFSMNSWQYTIKFVLAISIYLLVLASWWYFIRKAYLLFWAESQKGMGKVRKVQQFTFHTFHDTCSMIKYKYVKELLTILFFNF